MSDWDKVGIETAYQQAAKSLKAGGVPVGAALMLDEAVIAVGHNQRFQKGSNVLHGEMDCLEQAGHGFDFSRATLYTTLSPCVMCTGAILLFRIPRVVILDNVNTQDFETSEDRLRAAGVEVVLANHAGSMELNRRFQTEPATRSKWVGDVGQS
jgi:cytosine deaminase